MKQANQPKYLNSLYYLIIIFLNFIATLEATNAPIQNPPENYIRKSISSTGTVYTLSNTPYEVNPTAAYTILEKKIALQRFDTNPLPTDLTQSFSKEIYSQPNITKQTFKSLIKSTFSDEIKQILENPKVQKDRIMTFKDTKRYTFESTKGKSYSVTEEDLTILMNTSFIYIPYITQCETSIKHFKEKEDNQWHSKKELKMTLSGGIIWYQLNYSADGSVTIKQIKDIHSKKTNSVELFEYEDVTPFYQSLENEVLTKWASDLQYQTKSIEAFKLHGKILEQNNTNYQIGIYNNEGVQLDDTFWIMELNETNNILSSTPVGMGYISHIGSKNEIYATPSKLHQIYGTTSHLASWVLELPRKGIEARLGIKRKVNFHISPTDTLMNNIQLMNNTISSSTALHLNLALNISKFTGTSQFYADLDMSGGFVDADLNQGSLASIFDVYIGLRKRYWLQKFALNSACRIGSNTFFIGAGSDLIRYEMSVFTLQYDIGIEKMITPHWSMHANYAITATLGQPNVSTTYYSGFFETTDDYTATSSRLNWWSFGVGFNRSF